MKKLDEKMMDAFMMQVLGRVTAFDMFAQAMVYVHAAAEAGGTIDLFKVGPLAGPFEGSSVTETIFEEQYLPVFGEVTPWPEEKENPTPEERTAFLEAEKNFVRNFTLNENGWKFAEQIKQIREAMKDIAPTQEQLNQWTRDLYAQRKKEALSDNNLK